MQRLVAALAAAALILAGLAVGVAPASARTSAPAMSGWLPYWLLGTSTNVALANDDLFDDVSPFWYDAQADGTKESTVHISETWISSSSRPVVTNSLATKGIKVLPSITDSTGTRYLSGVMQSTAKRSALVTQIADLVQTNGYDGIDLDFETFAFSDGQGSWTTTKPAWVAFIAELANVLHAADKELAVSVPPMYSDGTGYWVYAFRDIAEHIDRLRIMAYDYSWSTAGSIGGPLSWVRQVLSYAVSAVPASKVYLGTPTYGRDWITSVAGTGCPSLSSKTLNTNAVDFSGWSRDPASQERTRSYTQSYNSGACTAQRTAWVPDEVTTLARYQVATEYGIGGLAQWMVGTEQSTQWDLLREAGAGGSDLIGQPPGEPTPQPTVPSVDVPALTEAPAVVSTTSPVSVRVARTTATKAVLKGKVIGAIGGAAKLRVRKAGEFRKYDRVKLTSTGKYRFKIGRADRVLRLLVSYKGARSEIVVVPAR